MAAVNVCGKGQRRIREWKTFYHAERLHLGHHRNSLFKCDQMSFDPKLELDWAFSHTFKTIIHSSYGIHSRSSLYRLCSQYREHDVAVNSVNRMQVSTHP